MRNIIQNRIGRIIPAIAIAATLLLAACGREPAAPASPPIRIGAYYWPGMYWLDIADRKGWFKEAGLNVERVDTNADYFASFADLVAGRLDIVGFTQFDFILYNSRGQRLTAFLATDYSNGSEALVARPGIARVRDLAGKRLALAEDTYLDYIWAVAAQRAGLRPGAVRIVDTPAEKTGELLARGGADAILTWEPFATEALTRTGGVRLFDTSQVAGLSWSLLTARTEFLERRAADVQALVRVWRRTEQFIRENPDAAYAIVAEVNRKSAAEVRDFTVQDKVLGLHDNLAAFSYAAGLDSLHGSTRQMNDFIVRHGLAKERLDTSSLFEPRFVQALQIDRAEP